MNRVAAYVRLSKEDYNNEISVSIKNQLEIIKQYVKKNNLKLIGEYIDDGYSGTNFDRPAFKKLISDIEKNKIDIVITKDLSRLGRDYIESGYYIEKYFPQKRIRYIAIIDGVDTSKDIANNDIAPFKSLFNDMVSKDTSKKIKSILKAKKEQGLFLGSEAPFGYKKDENNKHKLIIDYNVYKIIKLIYKLALDNKSITEIKEILNKKNTITPSKYKNKKNYYDKWSSSTVRNILTNKVYIGDTVQNKYPKINYKIKKRYLEKPENFIIKENTHEPIIDRKIFNLINNKMFQKRKTHKREKKLFEGKIYCQECKSKMSISYNQKRKKYTIRCNNYIKKRNCSSHYNDYSKVEEKIITFLTNELNIPKKLNIKKNINIEKNLNVLKKRLISLYEKKKKI